MVYIDAVSTIILNFTMSQIPELLDTLKRELKTHGLTYADIAAELGLSENSIKRLFSTRHCSLQRLEQICELANTSLAELASRMEANRHRVDMLSERQEREIAADIKLLLVATCALNHWTFDEIVATYRISEHECTRALSRLDTLAFIELLPLNRFKLRVANNFRWRPDGPIQQFFQQQVQPDFFDSHFNEPGAKLLFSSGMLSRESNARLIKKMEQLVGEFTEQHKADATLALDERFGTSLVIAIRAWEFGQFNALRRNPKAQRF